MVARSDSDKWMGKAAYRMAKQAEWGDLWPSFYNLNPKRQVVPPPTAPGLYEEAEDEGEEDEDEEEEGEEGMEEGGRGGGREGGRQWRLGRPWRMLVRR